MYLHHRTTRNRAAALNNILAIYSVLFLIGTGRAFRARQARLFLPQIVPPEHFVNAVTWGAATFQFANVTGPALGGILFTLPLITIGAHLPQFGSTLANFEGPPIVYCFTFITLLWFLLLVGNSTCAPANLSIAN